MLAQVSSYWNGLSKSQRFAGGVAAGAVLSIFSGLLATTLEAELGVRAPSMSFLLSVILAAIWFGRRVALVTAIFAFLVYNFYLVEPRYTFGFAGFEDVFTLLVFISVALLIGTMAGNLHDQRERAREQVRVLSGLFTVSRSMAECTSEREALEQLASGAREVVAQDAVVYGEDGAGIGEPTPLGTGDVLSVPWQREEVSAEGERVAVLAWKRAEKAPGAEQAIAVKLLVELARVAIERTRIVQRRVEMDTLAATERLRTALLSSISHDFRTPISTILTSASSLRAFGDQFPPATSADLLVTIEEEAERLNHFVGNVLNMTRLEANVVKPRVEWNDPLEIIEAVQQRLSKRVLEDNFIITAPAAVPSIFVDPLLLEQALVNVIENALVHASGGKLHIGADYSDATVRMWVEDEGPGVPQSDLPRIFDKFHRLDGSRNTQGVGLGLAITKGFVEAMKGEVSATSPVRDGRGLRVEFVFPVQADLVSA
ncbi:MAG: ATP-binding protein [Terricaulis sp.]